MSLAECELSPQVVVAWSWRGGGGRGGGGRWWWGGGRYDPAVVGWWRRSSPPPSRRRCPRRRSSSGPSSSSTVHAHPGWLSGVSFFLCKSIVYGAFVWVRRALNGRERRFPARAVLYSECAAVESRAEVLRTAPGVHDFIARCRVDLDEGLLPFSLPHSRLY